jgi:hypothetical protein
VAAALLLLAWGWLLKSQGVAPILDPPPVHEAHHHADSGQ